ncbi:MAG: 30S ribosomal protein S19e [Candidatus Woesearchaeota archaeon]
MVTYKDVPPTAVIEAVSEELQKNESIKSPEWAAFVKTGVSRERQPINPHWWFVRCAAILRTVAEIGPIGTNKLRIKYGGKKRRGYKKSRFELGSGSVARKALQQLEAAGLIKQSMVGNRKGRTITPQGQKLLDVSAGKVAKVEKDGNK